jgi:nitrite reductase (NADH) large subunit
MSLSIHDTSRTVVAAGRADGRRRLVVVGNGMAGARAVEELLARGGGSRFEITVFGDEPCGNYNRILLSEVLAGRHEAHDIFLHPLGWYEENDVTLHAGERVVEIDRELRQVVSASGRTVRYDLLLIATGSRPFIPPMEGLTASTGARKGGVFVFRTLEDCRRIRERAAEARKAVVVGGGLLGLEAARGLVDYGMEVHVVQRATHLMNQQLDPDAGAILRKTIEAMGVTVHLDRGPEQLLGDEHVTGVVLDDGTTLDCDLVVLACGVQPNVDLARAAGLTVERAICVDDQMRSVDDPGVYAVGECAEHRGRTYGIVAPLWEQANVLADHLSGRRPEAAYQGSAVVTRLKVMGVELASMGEPEAAGADDEVIQFIEPRRGVYQKLVIRDDRLVGAILLGDTSRAPYLMQAYERCSPLPAERAALLFQIGVGGGQISPEEMPEEATVCHCNGVSKGEIRECVLGGGTSLHSVMRATRAGTGCGSCKTLVRALVDRCVKAAAAVEAASV